RLRERVERTAFAGSFEKTDQRLRAGVGLLRTGLQQVEELVVFAQGFLQREHDGAQLTQGRRQGTKKPGEKVLLPILSPATPALFVTGFSLLRLGSVTARGHSSGR